MQCSTNWGGDGWDQDLLGFCVPVRVLDETLYIFEARAIDKSTGKIIFQYKNKFNRIQDSLSVS